HPSRPSRRLEVMGHADLRAEEIQARIRVSLAAVRKMLIERADVHAGVLVHAIRKPGRRQDVERKILALGTKYICVAVDNTESDAARDVGCDAPAGLHEVVTHARRDTEVVRLGSAEDRLGHAEEIKLIVAVPE